MSDGRQKLEGAVGQLGDDAGRVRSVRLVAGFDDGEVAPPADGGIQSHTGWYGATVAAAVAMGVALLLIGGSAFLGLGPFADDAPSGTGPSAPDAAAASPPVGEPASAPADGGVATTGRRSGTDGGSGASRGGDGGGDTGGGVIPSVSTGVGVNADVAGVEASATVDLNTNGAASASASVGVPSLPEVGTRTVNGSGNLDLGSGLKADVSVN